MPYVGFRAKLDLSPWNDSKNVPDTLSFILATGDTSLYLYAVYIGFKMIIILEDNTYGPCLQEQSTKVLRWWDSRS
jgi:hypothetical protein